MKRIFACTIALVLTLALASAAFAETIRPVPTTVDLNNLANRVVRTDVTYKGDGKMTLTLFELERFDAEAIRNVKAGDVIVTEGEEVAVESIDEDGPDIIFNMGKENEMLFCDNGNGQYEHVMENDFVPWIRIGEMDKEILEYFPIIDIIDPLTGEALDDYTVYDGARLKELLENPDAVGFDVKNVDIAYDANGEISMMRRYYSPAQ